MADPKAVSQSERVGGSVGFPSLALGAVGYGWVMRHCYAPVLQEAVAPFDLCAIADPSPDMRAVARQSWPRAQVAANLDTLALDALDAVLIASPNMLHLDQAVVVLRRGTACLIEKPAIRNLTDLALLKSVAGNGPLVAPAVACRFRPDAALWLDWTTQLGGIKALDLQWIRHRGIPGTAWHHAAADGWTGAHADLGAHLIDLAGAALGWNTDNLLCSGAISSKSGTAATADWYADRGQSAAPVPASDDRLQATFEVAGARLGIVVAWSDATPGDLVVLSASGPRGTARLEGLFGFSNDRRTPHQRVEWRDPDGYLLQRQEFPPGPDLHIDGFRAMVVDFATRVRQGAGIDWRALEFAGAIGTAIDQDRG